MKLSEIKTIHFPRRGKCDIQNLQMRMIFFVHFIYIVSNPRMESCRSFWTTLFSWFDNTCKEDLYTVNTFYFDSDNSAKLFADRVSSAKKDAIIYRHNRGQGYSVDHNGKTVTITWGDNIE